jgi:putative peptide zinc metalloprotease protein
VTTSLFSPSWYRVADIKPRLRSHAKVHRQHFRGQLWYVLQDQASGRYHRFSPSANLVISLMDGHRSVQEIWDLACSRLDEDVLTQDEMIRLLAQLHRSDVLHGDVPPDLGEMSERAAKQQRRKLMMSFLNPLAVRLPLIDPERFLGATFPLVRPLFSWFGMVLLLAVVGTAIVFAGVHWPALTENITDRVLAAESLLLLVVTYPLVKALHELGHGYAVKKWGGEVHEMGVMFLVLMPVPYVDASASAAFREKWRRALVGAAGIIVELLLASIALFAWLHLEPGLVRAFAFNVMLIGGVSTLLFNGNPLLRFDGYYVLSDLLEIPNLAQRANRYLGYLVQRHLFRVADATNPVTARGEAAWFVFYGLAAFIYRLFIMVAIVLFVASKFFVIGVVLAIWSCLMMYGLPLAKGLWFLMTSPTLRRRRGRAFGVIGGALAAAALVLLAMPVPYGTVTEGVVWTPGDAVIHARAEGVVAEVLAQPNSRVAPGDPLIQMEEPFLAARVRVLEAEVKELELRYTATNVDDRAEAKIVRERLRHARAELALNRQRSADLLVRSRTAGWFILPRAADLPGHYVNKGETLAYVVDYSAPIVRVVVNQDVIDLVRQRTRAIEVRLADRLSRVLSAEPGLEMPSATDRLPSLALSTMGGGQVVMDPSGPDEIKALERLFLLDLHLDSAAGISTIGGRVHVRFDHGTEALAWRIYRTVRQLFLRQFNV